MIILGKDDYSGVYDLGNGMFIECHESLEGLDDIDEKPDGAVYYTLYKDGEEWDGGVMGYWVGDTFEDLLEYAGCEDVLIENIKRIEGDLSWL